MQFFIECWLCSFKFKFFYSKLLQILKTQIESYLSKWKLTGEELGENAKQQWEKMIEMAKLSFGKVLTICTLYK